MKDSPHSTKESVKNSVKDPAQSRSRQCHDEETSRPVAGIILAGGQSRRMGDGDKAWKKLSGRFLIEHVVARAAPQVALLGINTAEHSPLYHRLNLPIIPDSLTGRLGPLAGVLSALEWAGKHNPPYHQVASFAVDTPFFPHNLVACLAKTLNQEHADIACAVSGQRRHPVFSLWPVALADDLRTCLKQGMRKIEDWTNRHHVALHRFEEKPIDPFFNVNRPEELAIAEKIISTLSPGR